MTDLADRVRRDVLGDAPFDLDRAVRAAAGGIVDDATARSLRDSVAAELAGAGPLEPLLALPGVTDVLVNGPGEVWLDRGQGLERAAVRFPDDQAVRRLAQRLAAQAGRRLDDATPFVDAALGDGTRLHAVLAPIAAATTLSLRVLARRRYSLPALVACGTLTARVSELLSALLAARIAFVITGGTGCGKTTLLGTLLSGVSAGERLLIIEDAPELVLDHPHVVRLVTRRPNVEGAGGIGLRDLVRQALRMRPDRLVVGEFRGPEMIELLVALNTGHEGGAATLHANSAADVPARLTALGALAGVTPDAVASLAVSALRAVIQLRRERDGRRVVAEIALLSAGPADRASAGAIVIDPVWSATRGVGAAAPRLGELLAVRGVSPPELLRAGGSAP